MQILAQIDQMLQAAKRKKANPTEILVPHQRAKELVDALRWLDRKKNNGTGLILLNSGPQKDVGILQLFGCPVRLSLGDQLLVNAFLSDAPQKH